MGWKVAGAGLMLLAAAAAAPAAEDLSEVIQYKRVAAAGGKELVIVYPTPGSRITPGGLAIDRAGNLYISDMGRGAKGEGSIVMVPKATGRPLRILQDLDKPADVELSPDQRALIVGEEGGVITRRYFGISIRLINMAGVEGDYNVYVKTDSGTRKADYTGDGYFHVMDILRPEQVSGSVDVVIEHDGVIFPIYDVFLGQPGESTAFGQTIVDIGF